MPVIDLLQRLPAPLVDSLKEVIGTLKVGNDSESNLTELSFDTDLFLFTLKVQLRWRHEVELPSYLLWICSFRDFVYLSG
jgi:hypothetical protein